MGHVELYANKGYASGSWVVNLSGFESDLVHGWVPRPQVTRNLRLIRFCTVGEGCGDNTIRRKIRVESE